MKPSIFMRLHAFLTGNRIVALRHVNGEVTFEISRVTPFNELLAGKSTCKPDGTTFGVLKIREWKYV
jgi:hypothetical protein